MQEEKRTSWTKWLWIILSAAILCCLFYGGDPRNSAVPADPVEFVSWQDLKPGQKGFGLTTFKGTKPEKFYVEFCAVKPHPLYQKERVILVRMGWPLENSSGLHGMSGSPVYFEHEGKWKLVGAFAFGYGVLSSERALGGLTPIHAMLNQEKSLGLTVAAQDLKNQLKNSENLREALSKPIYIGEFQLLLPRLQTFSDPDSAKITNSEITRPKPGEAITILLAEGDYNIGTTCTVTYVKGNKFWACGHPLNGGGKVALPAFKSEIATSFKSPIEGFLLIAGTKDYVGFISNDNVFGIEGQIQELPKDAMLPVSFKVNINENGETKKVDFQFRVVKDKLYSGGLIRWAGGDLLGYLWNAKDPSITLSVATINVSGQKPIRLFDSSTVGNLWLAVSKAANAIDGLLNSQWNFPIKDVSIEVSLEAGAKVLLLDSYKALDKDGKVIKEVHLGDEITLALGLRNPDGSQQFAINIPLQIPDTLGQQSNFQDLDIYIESGNNFEERNPSKLPDHRPDNSKEFLKWLLINQRPPQNIYIQLVFPETRLKEKKPAEAPKMPKGKWHKVKNLDFLRNAKTTERMVVVRKLDSPLKEYIPKIKTNLSLKLLPKNEDKKAKKRKKYFLF